MWYHHLIGVFPIHSPALIASRGQTLTKAWVKAGKCIGAFYGLRSRNGVPARVFMLAGSTGWRRVAYIHSSVVRLHGRVPNSERQWVVYGPNASLVSVLVGWVSGLARYDVRLNKPTAPLPSRLIGRTHASEACHVGSSPAWAAKASYPSGKGVACKATDREFDSRRSLHRRESSVSMVRRRRYGGLETRPTVSLSLWFNG